MGIPPSEARVLVVEDDPDNLMVTLELLGVAGVTQVEWVTRGAEAAQAVERLVRVDLALIDLGLPDINGNELQKQLRAMPGCAHACFVAVTARVMADEVAAAQRAGFDGLIGKPLDFDRFPRQIRALLNGDTVWSAR